MFFLCLFEDGQGQLISKTKDVPLDDKGYNDDEWQNGPDDEQDQEYGPGWQHLDVEAVITKRIKATGQMVILVISYYLATFPRVIMVKRKAFSIVGNWRIGMSG
jgi:hypothetical protein